MFKMFKRFTYIMLVLLLCAQGCDSGSDGDSDSTNPPSGNGTGTITGRVLDYSNGNGISSARVTATGGVSATTSSDGSYTLSNVTYGDRVVVTASASNYAELSKIVNVSSTENTVNLTISLQQVDVTQTIDPTVTHTVTDTDSTASVTVPANGLVTDSGSAPVGNVTVNMTVIDPSSDTSIMPGDFTVSTGGSMESYGALTITFTDSQGNDLDLASGSQSTVRIPVAQRMAANAPATMPMFYFNSTTGYWVQEGTATLFGEGDNKYYEGTVAHFSTWNADVLYDWIYIDGCVEDLEGGPLSGITVISEGIDYIGTATATTNSSGGFRVPARPNSQVLVKATSGGTSSNTVTVYTASTNYLISDCLLLGEVAVTVKLTWGENPRDLDSHLVTPSNHIYYGNRGNLTSSPYIQLDVDDTSGYGPEVISIFRFEEPGTYTYSVYHFSGSSTITESPARVELNLNGVVTIFTPPAGQGASDRTWNIFELVVSASGNVTMNRLDTWTTSSPN